MLRRKGDALDKKKRRFFWDIFFASSYPLLLVIAFIVNHQKTVDGGSALGGKWVNGHFFVVSDKGIFQMVSTPEWFLNLVLSCLVLLLGLLAGIGFVYYAVKYFFYPLLKSWKKGSLP